MACGGAVVTDSPGMQSDGSYADAGSEPTVEDAHREPDVEPDEVSIPDAPDADASTPDAPVGDVSVSDAPDDPDAVSDAAPDATSLGPCIVSVAAGGDTTCALKDNGSLWCWGRKLGMSPSPPGGGGSLGTSSPSPHAAFPDGVLEVALGSWHGCALRDDQSVWCWGSVQGATGLDSSVHTDIFSAVRVEELGSGVVEIAAGDDYSCARKSNGEVWCWGANWDGQLGEGTLPTAAITNIKGPVQTDFPSFTTAIRVASGGSHTCATTVDGLLWCWGSNENAQLGIPDGSTLSPLPTNVQVLGNDVVDVGAGRASTCAIRADGSLWCWGSNECGQLGLGTVGAVAVDPQPAVGLPAAVRQVALGARHACAVLVDGTVWCWGNNFGGQLGTGSVATASLGEPIPQQVVGLGHSASSITAGTEHTCILDDAGEVHCWGSDAMGQLGDGPNGADAANESPSPVRADIDSCGHVGELPDVDGGAVDAGIADAAASDAATIDAGTAPLPSCAIDLSLGMRHSCARLMDGTLWCWGDNQVGQMGDGTVRSPVRQPAPAASLDAATATSAGDFHTCGLQSTGEIWCWGLAIRGQLGSDWPDLIATTPVQADAPGEAFVSVSAGAGASCGIHESGALWCWGVEQAPHPFWSAQPKPIAGLPIVIAATLGTHHGCALDGTHALWCWGGNSHGQLGNGTFEDAAAPTLVEGLVNGVREASAGYMTTCAIDAVGDLWCWGASWHGTLANGTTGDYAATPLHITDLAGVSHVDVGAGHVCAVLEDGSLWCWGVNSHGELGLGMPSNAEASPAEVTGLSTTTSRVACGWSHTCALLTDGSVWCWGWNDAGQVGDGTNGTDRASPAQVVEPCH